MKELAKFYINNCIKKLRHIKKYIGEAKFELIIKGDFMNYDIIISLIDDHNESKILLTEKYKPSKVLILYTSYEDIQSLSSLKQYYKNKFPNCTIIEEKIDEKNYKDIERIILRYKNNKILFNLTSGKKFISLIIYTLCLKNNIDCKYLNLVDEELTSLSIDKIINEKQNFIDLGIQDIVESIGGSIIDDSTDISNVNIIGEITNIIAKNLTIWETYKIKFTDNNIFLHDESNPKFIRVDMNLLVPREVELLNKCLKFLQKKNQIEFKYNDNYIRVNFLNNFIKGFIFKSGTWLEVFTKNIIEELEPVDDVKNGVLFLWNDKKKRVKNELDVVAVKDSILTCISCKDSKKYDEVALNELNVYAEQLGGENVIKVLVATKEPFKGSILERAKEMKINLIIFDGNIEKFKRNLERIIINKK